MKIGIVGSGISGMTAAYYLSRRHQVTVLEANPYIGGHTNTLTVQRRDGVFQVDTGFIVFNDRTYPNFIRLLEALKVSSQPTSMTFSVQCEATGLEYRGADFNGLFAQRSNLWKPSFYYLLSEIMRFNRTAEYRLEREDPDITVGDFFQRNRFGRGFREQFFLPMASAIWSCPNSTVERFPLRFIVDFYRHHGLLSVRDRPQWRVITGGSQVYMQALLGQCQARILKQTVVTGVDRQSDSVVVSTASGDRLEFDHLILACHSDQALRILGASATTAERDILSAFPYERNVAVLHTDERLLPKSRRAWASWNYHLPRQGGEKATLTYNMNLLQGLECKETFCVSLNCEHRIQPERIIQSIEYHHPVFTSRRREMQQRHGELLGPNRTSYCGAYWGNGFHEDGVVSALSVCAKLDRESCKVVSTKAGFDTDDIRPSRTPSAYESV